MKTAAPLAPSVVKRMNYVISWAFLISAVKISREIVRGKKIIQIQVKLIFLLVQDLERYYEY